MLSLCYLIRRPSHSHRSTLSRSSQQNLVLLLQRGEHRGWYCPPRLRDGRYRVRLGEGPQTYALAVEPCVGGAVRSGWVRLCWPDTPLEVGATVGVLARHYRFWSLNSARIVYVIEESGEVERFGFGYGTLPGHGERGEERFLVNGTAKTTWYTTTFSPSPGQTTLSHGPATHWSARFRGASRATRRRRWSGP
jgi:uncharacterized protein (UPF0548 family)